MTEDTDWNIPGSAQPEPHEFAFDLDRKMESVLSLRADVPDDAFTASILGTERIGNGVLIRDSGLVLTIGYLITEANSIWLQTNAGVVAPAHTVAYDQATGFGLVQAHGSLGVKAIELGNAAASAEGSLVIIIGYGGRKHSTKARVLAKQEFAGYWEYVLDEAIFTAPAHPNWGGTAMIGLDGKLQGIGSLYLEELQADDEAAGGNMIVQIDLLYPILDTMLAKGHAPGPPRPWLGIYAVDHEDDVVVAGLVRNGPAYKADLRVGDVVEHVSGNRPNNLADAFRKVWALGPAGVEVPLTLARGRNRLRVRVRSIDRNLFLKQPSLH